MMPHWMQSSDAGMGAGMVLGWVQGSDTGMMPHWVWGSDAWMGAGMMPRWVQSSDAWTGAGMMPRWVQGSDVTLGASLGAGLPQLPPFSGQGAIRCLCSQCSELAEAPAARGEEPPATVPDPGILAQPPQQARLPGGLRQPQPPALRPGCPGARWPRRVGGGGPGLRAVPELQLCLPRSECRLPGGMPSSWGARGDGYLGYLQSHLHWDLIPGARGSLEGSNWSLWTFAVVGPGCLL